MELFRELFEDELDQTADRWLVVRIAGLVVAMGDDAADCAGVVAEVGRYAGYRRAFHLEIRHAVLSEAETLECVKHIRHRKRHAQYTSLRAVES